MKRINSIDFTRGLVMIIMVLDHTRDFMHTTSLTQSPTDLATTTPLLFFTRWVTHLCAPTFVFLSGTSAYISLKSRNNLAAGRRFLFTRGVWLIILEFTLVNFGLWFDIHLQTFIFDVIAAIGFGFIILSLLLKASTRTIAVIGLLIIGCHDLFPFIRLDPNSSVQNVLSSLFVTKVFALSSSRMLVVGYPPIPWLGIMLLGFATGKIFEGAALQRKKIFLRTGLIALALFVLIRSLNVYGDPAPWATQKDGLYTFLSFINVTKYPPSLLFCLLMLGIMFLILSAIEGIKNKFTGVLETYGKVPLFYFIVHWYILHPILFAMVLLQGFRTSDMVFGFNFGRPKEGSGVELWVIYLIWIGVVVLMYPLCKWYGRYKANHKEKKWLRYF